MTADEKQKVLQLFLAGATYRQIASAVGIPQNKVHDAVISELSESVDRRTVLNDEAVAIHQERTEALFKAHWGSALRGDHRSAEICRRILERQGRQMLFDERPAMEGDAVDEIAARRAARRAGPASGSSRAKRAK